MDDYCLVCRADTTDSHAADLCDDCDAAIFTQPEDIFPVLEG